MMMMYEVRFYAGTMPRSVRFKTLGEAESYAQFISIEEGWATEIWALLPDGTETRLCRRVD